MATTVRRFVPRAMRMAMAVASQRGGGSALNHRCYHDARLASPIEIVSMRDSVALKQQQSRGYATGASENHIRPPMEIPTLAGKYAVILYVEAVKTGVLEQVESEIKEIGQATVLSSNFANFIRDISIPKHQQVKNISETFAKTSFSELTKKFLVAVTKNGRLKELKAIADCFSEMMKAKRGHVTAVVTTAKELTPQELETVKSQYISQMINPAETVFIEQKINEEILGGVIIQVRDKRLDLSIEKRIREIETILLTAV